MKEPTFPQSADRTVLRREQVSQFMTSNLVHRWIEEIKIPGENSEWEWRPTPLTRLNLKGDGYGEVLLKDESDRESNPTGTHKDRAAWEYVKLYRQFARVLWTRMQVGTLRPELVNTIRVPRMSLMTSGNEGIALAECLAKFKLPAPKLIVDAHADQKLIDRLTQLRAEIYQIDLTNRALTGDDILRYTENVDGVDLTSSRAFQPERVLYDWLAHEIFNARASRVYVPFGSGRLRDNLLYWQAQTMRNSEDHHADRRLKAHITDVVGLSVCAAEPESVDSVADKLTAPFKPFVIFSDADVKAMVQFHDTGRYSARRIVDEEHLQAASEIFEKHAIDAEPSAAAGLALYMMDIESGNLNKHEKVVVVNTGKGFVQE